MTQRHHCFQIQTTAGLQAKINGDPNMQPAARAALAELIDAAMKMQGAKPEECEICGANPQAGNPKHDPDCPNNPIYDVCEEKMTLEEFESL
jgi:hypothetical protein